GFSEQGVTNARGARVPGSVGIDSGPRGSGGLVTFTLGAAPGSIRASGALENLTPANASSPIQSMLTQGPAARATARAASRAFVQEIKRQVLAQDGGQRTWADFLR